MCKIFYQFQTAINIPNVLGFCSLLVQNDPLCIGEVLYRGSSHSADSHTVVLAIVWFLKKFWNIHIVRIPRYSVVCFWKKIRNIHIVWIPLYSVVWENIYSGVIKLDLFSPRYGQTQGYNLYNYFIYFSYSHAAILTSFFSVDKSHVRDRRFLPMSS